MTAPAITAATLASILSKPSNDRLEFEIRSVCEWFRQNVKYFKKITNEVLQTLVVECSVEKVAQNKVVIWEGEEGDRMFILLSGIMKVYRLNEIDKETLEENTNDIVPPIFPEDVKLMPVIEDPTILGQCLATLESGKIFGEVALIEKCTRSASIIAADECEMVVIPRELYNATVAPVLEEEFKMKEEFVESVSFFSCCSQKHKRQLLMALESHSCDFPTHIIKQGQSVCGMMFLMSGEVKLSCDPTSHLSQYKRNMESWKDESKSELIINEFDLHPPGLNRSLNKHKTLDICLLSPSKHDSSNKPCIGDLELLLNMSTSFCTASATSHCVLLTLHMRHFERILLKKYPQSIDIMMRIIHKRIIHWSTRLSPTVFLFSVIKERIKHIRELAKGNKTLPTLNEMSHSKDKNQYRYQPPLKGVLIDLFGPGSVFYYIKNQYKLREHSKDYDNPSLVRNRTLAKPSNTARPIYSSLERPESKEIKRIEGFSKDVGYSAYYDNHTKKLDERIKDFLNVLSTDKVPNVETMSDVLEKIPNMKYPKRANLVILKSTNNERNVLKDPNLSTEDAIKMIFKK